MLTIVEWVVVGVVIGGFTGRCEGEQDKGRRELPVCDRQAHSLARVHGEGSRGRRQGRAGQKAKTDPCCAQDVGFTRKEAAGAWQ